MTLRLSWIAVGGLSIAFAVAAAARTAGQSPDSVPALFVPLARSTASQTASEQFVRQRRQIGLREELLGTTAADAAQLPRRLRVDLFSGVSVVVERERWERRGPGRIVWHGRITGPQSGEMTVVSVPGALVGAIRVGERTYELRPDGADGYVLLDEDKAARFVEGPPIRTTPPPDRPVSAPAIAMLPDTADIIDLMVVYTPAARAGAGSHAVVEALIDLAIEWTNVAYADSAVQQRIRLVHRSEIAYVDSGVVGTDLGRLSSTNDGFMDAVHGLRDAHGADLVVLVSTSRDVGGMAFQPIPSATSASSGFSVVSLSSANGATFAHELGHNMGLSHDRANATGQSTFPYSYGYQDPPYFRTIMAYECPPPSSCPGIPYFSNPQVLYNGRPTGKAGSEDEARALNETAIHIANYRQTVHEHAYPALTGIAPSGSLEQGGTQVTLRGLGFREGMSVRFGSVAASSVTFIDNRTLRAVVPAHPVARVDVSVVSSDGFIGTKPEAFDYYSPVPARLLAGSRGGPGFLDGAAASARVDRPGGLASDGAGGVFFAERSSKLIRRVSASGEVTTFAGQRGSLWSRDGDRTTATFAEPTAVASDAQGNLYVVDNDRIRRISAQGVVTTLARGRVEPVALGIAVDAAGVVFVADTQRHQILRISSAGVVTTFAGLSGVSGSADGTGEAARFDAPWGVAVDPNGVVYVADRNNASVRRITPAGVVTTLAGGSAGYADGTGPAAQFASAEAIAVDGTAGVFVADGTRIRHVTPAGVVTTVAGPPFPTYGGHRDGPVAQARFDNVGSVLRVGSGLVFTQPATIRVLDGGMVSTLAGRPAVSDRIDGAGEAARFSRPGGIAVAADGHLLVIERATSAIRKVSRDNGAVTTLVADRCCYQGPAALADFRSLTDIARHPAGGAVIIDGNSVRRVAADGSVVNLAGQADASGSADGPGSMARFNSPQGLAVDAAGVIYVADTYNRVIRRIAIDGTVTTLAGLAGQQGIQDGSGTAARFFEPREVVVDGQGMAYVSDSSAIRRITPDGQVSTFNLSPAAFQVTTGLFQGIQGMAPAPDGRVYFLVGGTLHWLTADSARGTLPLLAEEPDAPGGSAPLRDLVRAEHLAVDEAGDLYVSGYDINSVWKLSIPRDVDQDTLDDRWEQRFGLDPGVATGNDGPDGDPDGDGVSNAGEYAAGTHPRGFYQRYLAEGAVNAFFDVRLALLNVGSTTTALQLRFLQPGGSTVSLVEQLAPGRRRSITRADLTSLTSPDFSTVLESDQPVVLDRTMTWDSSGFGSHAETGVVTPSTTWYLAEGSTSGDFSLFYLLQNPNPSPVAATVRYLLPFGQEPVVKRLDLAPFSRTTIPVDDQGTALASTDVSAVITTDVPIVVERAMYRNTPSQSFAAGHESAGVTAPATSWFLAEGATGPFFDCFILLANPAAQEAIVTVDYLLSTGVTHSKTYTVPAQGRFTIWVDNEDIPAGSGARPLDNVAVSSTVTSNVPIIVERTMWWPSPAITANYWTEAHNSPGATATGTRWALAEGEVGGAGSAETYILIANTSAFGGQARVTLYFEDGTSVAREFGLAAKSRTNVNASVDFPEAAGKRFGAVIESIGGTPAQIVVERAMYTSPGGATWTAGTNALATRLP